MMAAVRPNLSLQHDCYSAKLFAVWACCRLVLLTMCSVMSSSGSDLQCIVRCNACRCSSALLVCDRLCTPLRNAMIASHIQESVQQQHQSIPFDSMLIPSIWKLENLQAHGKQSGKPHTGAMHDMLWPCVACRAEHLDTTAQPNRIILSKRYQKSILHQVKMKRRVRNSSRVIEEWTQRLRRSHKVPVGSHACPR